MAYRISKENERLNGTNKELELENARLKGIIEEQFRNIKFLEEKNSADVARIATLEELNRQEKEARNLQLKTLRRCFDEYEEQLVCCQVFENYARVTISISVKRY